MHLMLDGLHKPPAEPFAAAARSFLEAYAVGVGDQVFDALLVRITGCLLLARLEGDSPIDYLSELDAPAVKRAALQLILNPCSSPQDALRQVLG